MVNEKKAKKEDKVIVELMNRQEEINAIYKNHW
jgi:hypothetical protein